MAAIRDQVSYYWSTGVKRYKRGSSELVKFLLQHRAQVDAPDNRGFLTLVIVFSRGYTEVARLLPENGADIYA